MSNAASKAPRGNPDNGIAYLNLLISPDGQPVEANVSRLHADQLPPSRYPNGIHTHRSLLQLEGYRTLAEAHVAARKLCGSWDLRWALELLDNHSN